MKSIEDLKSKLAYYEDQLKKYHEFFMQDGKIEPKEQEQLDEMQSWIDGIKDALKKKGLLDQSPAVSEIGKGTKTGKVTNGTKISTAGLAKEVKYTLLDLKADLKLPFPWVPALKFIVRGGGKIEASFAKQINWKSGGEGIAAEAKLSMEIYMELLLADTGEFFEGGVQDTIKTELKSNAKLFFTNPQDVTSTDISKYIEVNGLLFSVIFQSNLVFRTAKRVQNIIEKSPRLKQYLEKFFGPNIKYEIKIPLQQKEILQAYIASYKRGVCGAIDWRLGKDVKEIADILQASSIFKIGEFFVKNGFKLAQFIGETSADVLFWVSDNAVSIAASVSNYLQNTWLKIKGLISSEAAAKNQMYQDTCKQAVIQIIQKDEGHQKAIAQIETDAEIKNYIDKNIVPEAGKLPIVQEIYKKLFVDNKVNEAGDLLQHLKTTVSFEVDIKSPRVEIGKPFQLEVVFESDNEVIAYDKEFVLQLQYFGKAIGTHYSAKIERGTTKLPVTFNVNQEDVEKIAAGRPLSNGAWVILAKLDLPGNIKDVVKHFRIQ